MNNFLDIFNNRVFGLDEELELLGPSHHNIFIVGAPRSGTTLLSQLFAGCTDIAYPNNLMAAFWSAPVSGALMSQRWMGEKFFSGKSNFGQTLDYREPHEIGAFWRDRLKMQDMSQPDEGHSLHIDWLSLSQELDNITKVFSRPVVYKAFHLSWFICEISEKKPDSKWIFITRETTDNARSLLDLRRHLHNDISEWASSKPIGIEKYCNSGPYLEVVAQVELINKWIDSQLHEVHHDNWISLSLEALVKDPIGEFEAIASWSGATVNHDALKLASKNIASEVFDQDQEYKDIENAYKFFCK